MGVQMKKIIGVLIVVFILFGNTAFAEEPEHKMEVSVEDIMEVTSQIAEMDSEIDVLAKVIYAEARGVKSKMEQAAVAWCILNRVDHQGYGSTIKGVATAKHQFAYSSRTPVKEEFQELSKDVLVRWLLEKRGIENVGRVLPEDYLYFAGRGGHNHFRKNYRGRKYWPWILENPYEN